MYPDSALLRSLVVDEAAQGKGLGGRLTQAAIEEAQRRDVHAIYLLTTTAEQFFPRFGFVAVDRQSMSLSIRDRSNSSRPVPPARSRCGASRRESPRQVQLGVAEDFDDGASVHSRQLAVLSAAGDLPEDRRLAVS